MVPSLTGLLEEARMSARAMVDYGSGLFNPTVRLGVTGLSRAGKTVFITALIHALLRGGRFPVFEALDTGRIAGSELAPQPDDMVPRFSYEAYVDALVNERRWPQSTVDISELRLVIDYQRHNGATSQLTLDIVDYPGEWLLDLPLLSKSYEQWAAESLALSRMPPRDALAKPWHDHLATMDPMARQDEAATQVAAKLFTAYLRACRDERYAMSLLPPGRFLMPGSLADSPALTFAPLDVPQDGSAPDGSLWAMMRRRYEAYKSAVVRPFFRDHFSRLDRQIVLVDALSAFNAGPDAVRDLEAALSGILDCFRVGRSTWMSALFRPRIDRILFAATKADHLHHSSHDRLEDILKQMVTRAADRASFAGAQVDVVAMAALRATREAQVRHNGETLPAILGIPQAGESDGGTVFDGETEVATFPGDLPSSIEAVLRGDDAKTTGAFRGLTETTPDKTDFRFLRFRPPRLSRASTDEPLTLPHIRLDRALQFLIGDRLQ